MTSKKETCYSNRFHTYYSKIFRIFGEKENNPFFNLGSTAFLCFVISCVSGIPLLFFYKVAPDQAYISVVSITQDRFLSFLRNLHRYSSDAFMLFVALHFIKELISGRFRRLLPWISGVFLIFLVFVEGFSGFLLVWDEKAKFMGIETIDVLSVIPFFDKHISTSFLLSDVKFLSGIFRVSLIFHVFFSVFLLFVFLIHIAKVSKPRILPGKFSLFSLSLFLMVISILFPASIDGDASASKIPFDISFDWFYFFAFPISDAVGEKIFFAVGFLAFVLLIALPILFRVRNKPHIDLEKCEGCLQCFLDCPYNSIEMKGEGRERKAFVVGWSCAGCGICVGACGVEGIYMDVAGEPPQEDYAPGENVAFLCVFSDLWRSVGSFQVFRVPCIGYVNMKRVEELFSRGVKKIYLFGCSDCYYRLGDKWEYMRVMRKRRPTLSREIDDNMISFVLGENLERKSTWGRLKVLLLLFSFVFIIPFLSNSRFQVYPEGSTVVVISGEYLSSPSEFIELKSSLQHMRKMEIPAGRSAVLLSVELNGRKLISKTYEPQGIRKEGTIKIFEELVFEEGGEVKIILREVDKPENSYSFSFQIEGGDSALVILKDSEFHLER